MSDKLIAEAHSVTDTDMTAMLLKIATVKKDYYWYDLAGSSPVILEGGIFISDLLVTQGFADLVGVTLYQRVEQNDLRYYGCHWTPTPTKFADGGGRPISFFLTVEWRAEGANAEYAKRNALEFAARLIEAGQNQTSREVLDDLLMATIAEPEVSIPLGKVRQSVLDYVNSLRTSVAPIGSVEPLDGRAANMTAADTPTNRRQLVKALRNQLPGMDKAGAAVLVAVLEDSYDKALGRFAWRGLTNKTNQTSAEEGWRENPTSVPARTSESPRRDVLLILILVLAGAVWLAIYLISLFDRKH